VNILKLYSKLASIIIIIVLIVISSGCIQESGESIEYNVCLKFTLEYNNGLNNETKKFDESLDFFNKIVIFLKELNENPYLLIFIHKVDPEIKNKHMIQEHIQQLKNAFKFKLDKFPLNYDIFLTSIYSSFPQRPQFLRLVRELIDGKSITNDDLEAKIEGFGNILKSTLNAVIDLSSKVMEIEKKLNLQNPPQIPLENEEKSPKILMNKVISELNNVIIKKENELE